MVTYNILDLMTAKISQQSVKSITFQCSMDQHNKLDMPYQDPVKPFQNHVIKSTNF
jgi:hypothetical protein